MSIKENNGLCMRNTKQKSLILDCLRDTMDRHLTAEGLIDKLRSRNTPVARATVYRYLSSLEESGIVRKYAMSEGVPACYQFIGEQGECREHYHLMCLDCSKIVHFENDTLQKLFETMNLADNFMIDGGKTVFYGKCNKCCGR